MWSRAALPPETWRDPAHALAASTSPWDLATELMETGERVAIGETIQIWTEQGRISDANHLAALREFYDGNIAGALQALELSPSPSTAKFRERLQEELNRQIDSLELPSDHFRLRLSSDVAFLGDYALPALESAQAKLADLFPITETETRIELYPTLALFAQATGLPRDTIERTGTRSLFRYDRVLLVSPQATTFGYRWIDTMVHEYVHRQINHLSGGRCPAWLQEGTARCLEREWRMTTSSTAAGDDDLLASGVNIDTATLRGLISFSEMDAGFLSLRTPDQVALAFAQTADAVRHLIDEHGRKALRSLFSAFRTQTSDQAFLATIGMSESEFEDDWKTDLLERIAASPHPLPSGDVPSRRWGIVNDLDLTSAPVATILRRGDQLRQKRLPSAARSEYEKARAMAPRSGVVLLRLADMDLDLDHPANAEKHLRRAIAENPDFVTPYIRLGRLLYDDGRYEEAQAQLQSALEIQPFDPEIHETLGLIALDMGHFAASRGSLQRALRLDPQRTALRDVLRRMPKDRR